MHLWLHGSGGNAQTSCPVNSFTFSHLTNQFSSLPAWLLPSQCCRFAWSPLKQGGKSWGWLSPWTPWFCLPFCSVWEQTEHPCWVLPGQLCIVWCFFWKWTASSSKKKVLGRLRAEERDAASRLLLLCLLAGQLAPAGLAVPDCNLRDVEQPVRLFLAGCGGEGPTIAPIVLRE